jgi:hypothetical protein
VCLCDLFNKTGSSWAVWRPVVGRLMNDELERIWKEVNMICDLFRHLSGGTE